MEKLTEDRINRERYLREDRRDSVPAVALSLAVHGALFAGLFSAFQWNTAPEAVYAELWAPEEISAGSDPEGVAERLPEEAGRDEAKEQETPPEASRPAPEPEPSPEPTPEPQPEPEPEPAPAPEPETPPPPPSPTPEEIAAKEAAEAQRLESERLARAAQEELEARRAEAERIAQERARAEEIERMRQEAIEAERRKAEEEQRRLEEERLAQERIAEAARRAEEERKAEEARRAEEARVAEEARKAEAARLEEENRLKAEAEARRVADELHAEAERRAQEEAARKEAKRVAAEQKAREQEAERRRVMQKARQQELARLSAKVDPNAQRSGAPGGNAQNFRRSLTGTALATWSNKVRACIRQRITIDVPSSTQRGRYRAEYALKLLPTGEQVGAPRLVKPSGWPAYDSAVARAIRSCNPLPRPEAGRDMPREITLAFDPVEDKQ